MGWRKREKVCNSKGRRDEAAFGQRDGEAARRLQFHFIYHVSFTPFTCFSSTQPESLKLAALSLTSNMWNRTTLML